MLILERVVRTYPKSNRAGSAMLYLARLSSGEQREAYLKKAIKDHGDTWYGNGVQVGALARSCPEARIASKLSLAGLPASVQ